MTVSQIASIAAGLSRSLGNKNTDIASSVASLLTSSSTTTTQPDISALSTAAFLQNQVASLRIASQNIAQGNSALDVASGGAQQIAATLQQLQDLATQATASNLSDSERNQLNIQFQSLRQQINRIANSASFNGQTLLVDGSGGDSSLAIGGLTDSDLFGGNANLNLLSADSAGAALDAVKTAEDTTAQTITNIVDLQTGLATASATVESALQNQNAASSTLDDTDFAGLTQQSAQDKLQAQATSSLLAQTSKLPNNLLALLTE